MLNLESWRRLLQKDAYGSHEFRLEASVSWVKNFETFFWTKGVTIIRIPDVFKYIGMLVRVKMFVDAGGDVSVGFTYTYQHNRHCSLHTKIINNSRSQVLRDRILDPKQTTFILFFADSLNVLACVT